MDKYVCATDVGTGKILRKYRGHAGTVNCVKYNEDSSVILSGSTDNSVRIWDCKSRKLEPLQVPTNYTCHFLGKFNSDQRINNL